MHKITLVCSAHRENGLCTAGELLKVLRALEPEVVFEEIRPSDSDSLEAWALTSYRAFKSFQRVSVDRYDIPENLLAEIKRDSGRVFDFVARVNQEYRSLDEENNISVYQYGFSYLNSAACATRMATMSEIEEKAIIETGDQALICGLERWRHFVQKREFEMIGNIYEYCRKNVFDTGVFLVGAAHKADIVKEIGKYAGAEADLIDWNFAYDGQIP